MCILINTSVLSTGMGLGFPAVTISALSNQTSAMALTDSEVSWFGKIISLFFIFRTYKSSFTLLFAGL